MINEIPVRVGIQQRVLPRYRIPFFDALASEYPEGLSIFAGEPRKEEALDTGSVPLVAKYEQGKNIHLFSGIFYLCWQSGLLKWLETWNPEVLIMEANPRYIRSGRATRWMKAKSRKVIGWGLGSPPASGFSSNIRMSLRRRFINQFDALITYSRQGALEYAELGYPAHRIFTAPNAVAPRPRHDLPERGREYMLGRPTILFVGRLQLRKRVDDLIRACSKLPPLLQPFLRIVGDGPCYREFKSISDEIYPDARFYGAQYGSDLEKHFREADLFVLPGTGGLAVQQAMSFGLPVIVGVSDGTQNDLVRDENGWILPDAGVETLSNQIEQALSDIGRLRELGRASYRIVREEVNLENMVDIFQQAIFSVLKE